MKEERVFWTIKEVASYLNIKPSTLYSWSREGGIPHYRMGRILRFRREDIDAWVEGHRKEAKGQEKKAEAILRGVSGRGEDIDHLVKKTIAQVKGNLYTSSHRETRPIKGLGKEVEDGIV